MNHEVRGSEVSGDVIITAVAVRLAGGVQRDEEVSRGFVRGRVIQNVKVVDVHVLRQIHDPLAAETTTGQSRLPAYFSRKRYRVRISRRKSAFLSVCISVYRETFGFSINPANSIELLKDRFSPSSSPLLMLQIRGNVQDRRTSKISTAVRKMSVRVAEREPEGNA